MKSSVIPSGKYYLKVGGAEYIKLGRGDEIMKIKGSWYNLYGYRTKRGFFSSKGEGVLAVSKDDGSYLCLKKTLKDDIYTKVYVGLFGRDYQKVFD